MSKNMNKVFKQKLWLLTKFFKQLETKVKTTKVMNRSCDNKIFDKKLRTKVFHPGYAQKFWAKVRTKSMIKSYEHKLWNEKCDKKIWSKELWTIVMNKKIWKVQGKSCEQNWEQKFSTKFFNKIREQDFLN